MRNRWNGLTGCARSLTTWWALQLNDIALGIRDIDGRAFSFGAVARCNGPNLDAMRLQMPANTRLVEWLYPKAKVIEVAPLVSRSCAADSAKFSIDGHKVDDGPARSQLNQTDLILAPLDCAAKGATVEMKHAIEVDNAQYKMVDFANVDHGLRKGGVDRPCSAFLATMNTPLFLPGCH